MNAYILQVYHEHLIYLLYPLSTHPSLHLSFLGLSEYNAEVSILLSKYYSMHIINWSLIFVYIFSFEVNLISVHCLKCIFIEFLTNAYIYVTQTSIKIHNHHLRKFPPIPSQPLLWFFFFTIIVLLILEYRINGNTEYILLCKASFAEHPSFGIY